MHFPLIFASLYFFVPLNPATFCTVDPAETQLLVGLVLCWCGVGSDRGGGGTWPKRVPCSGTWALDKPFRLDPTSPPTLHVLRTMHGVPRHALDLILDLTWYARIAFLVRGWAFAPKTGLPYLSLRPEWSGILQSLALVNGSMVASFVG